MNVYDFFSRISISKKSYALKFFLATLPIVLAALGVIVLLWLELAGRIKVPVVALIALGVLLVIISALTTLFIFNRLLKPLDVAIDAMDQYIENRTIPVLPGTYEDEAGLLMVSVQETITKLERLIIEKSDMIDLLSHDLRSPVGRILALSNLIKDEEGAEKELYADYIVNECTGLLSMLENILMILKEENQEFRLEFVNLHQLIDETLAFFQFSIADKKLAMEVSVDENIYMPIQPQLFKQALRNIIGNAIKFSPEGKKITIQAKQDEDHIELCVKDQGLGFKPSDMKKIFERFTTAGKKGTHGEASTGLGLYLSKKIIENHGGILEAESEGEYKGASFKIILYRLIIKKPQEKTSVKRNAKTIMAVRHR